MDPLTLLSLAGGLGGGGTKVNTSNKTNVATQLSLGISNMIGGGSPTASGGTQTAPNTQTTQSGEGGYIPVFGANPSSDPQGDLNNLVNGTSGASLSSIAGNKTFLIAGAALIAIGAAVYFGKGK